MPTLLGTAEVDETVQQGVFTVVGAATPHAALSDASDASYVQQGIDAATYAETLAVGVGSGIPALPPNTRISSVTVVYRAAQFTSETLSAARIDVELAGVGSLSAINTIIVNGLIFDWTVNFPSRPGGGAWQVADIANLTLRFVAAFGDTPLRIYRAYVAVYVNSAPTATPTGPVGSVTDTADPYLTWAYSDPDSDAQEMFEAKIFFGANVVADPTTETERLFSHIPPLAYSGTVIRANDMSNGNYRWAVRVKDVGSPPGSWGPWGQAALVIEVPAPFPPILTVVPQPDEARYLINAIELSGPNPTEAIFIARSNDGGASWEFIKGASVDNPIPYVGDPINIYDYEAPRMAAPWTPGTSISVGYNEPIGYNAPLGYNESALTAPIGPENVVRYMAVATRTYNGETLYSNWSVPVTPQSLLGGDTRLKHPTDPSKNIVIQAMANFESASEEQLQALRASGRADYVVFGDIPSLEKGELDIIFPGDAAWQAFEALRAVDVAVPLLLQTCFGDTVLEQMWIRLGATRSIMRITHKDQHIKQYRRAKVGFYQTLRPIT